MIETTHVIEKYELKICSAIRQIDEIKKLIGSQKGIKRFAQQNPNKLGDAVRRLKNAQIELQLAIKCLLDSGN